MDLQPLRDFVARHQLETEPVAGVLEVAAHAGRLAETLLRDTDYGRRAAGCDAATAARMAVPIGDLMFAIAYLSTLYAVDPEAAMWDSVRRFEEKLNQE
jgi:hypothetical protein